MNATYLQLLHTLVLSTVYIWNTHIIICVHTCAGVYICAYEIINKNWRRDKEYERELGILEELERNRKGQWKYCRDNTQMWNSQWNYLISYCHWEFDYGPNVLHKILFYQEKLPKSNAMMNGWMSEIHICVTVSLTILSHSIDSRMFWFESDK